MERRLVLGVLLMTVLGGCGVLEEGVMSGSVSEGRSGRGVDPGEAEPGEVEPGVLKGRVVDAQGRPIEGAEIVADNQVLYDSNEVVRTGGDGRYRVATNIGVTFHASATMTRRYNGREYTLSLAPDDDAPFAGPSGAIRNFTWKLSGEKPDGLGFYGGKVLFRVDLNDQLDAGTFLEDEKVRLTLVPDGPLIDGSEGSRIVRTATRNGDGSGLEDVPIGRYRITADYEGRPLGVKLRDGGDYAQEVVADFTPVMTGVYWIELELGLPRG
ncbi:carboxypeptidase-like regulatory domain-containing protein [Microbispora sp. H13382]|uniref:carboxypeptidase-like regulatory domain-containing protein n=1 Tax=Microbispora sp. H13382 TaxID=2729112 RepID=UPI00160226CB|nr:carboxypeptidase-like regulatory domain-containing protein [Microbispora sp. H13382]